MAYARHFFSAQLEKHFREEEQILFPILGSANDSVRRALREHKNMERLFFEETDSLKACSHIVRELDIHIRFEERILFNEIQDKASATELSTIAEQLESDKTIHAKETWHDPFWKVTA